MSTSEFHPDDITELETVYNAIIFDNENGFTIEFSISLLGAKELVELHGEAVLGSRPARRKSWAEYTKIIVELQKALDDAPTPD